MFIFPTNLRWKVPVVCSPCLLFARGERARAPSHTLHANSAAGEPAGTTLQGSEVLGESPEIVFFNMLPWEPTFPSFSGA